MALFPNLAGINSLPSCFSLCVYIAFKVLSSSVVIVIGLLSGHTAVNVGKSKVVVFGGLFEKRFLSDIMVYDIGTLFLMSMGGFLLIFSARFFFIGYFLSSISDNNLVSNLFPY